MLLRPALTAAHGAAFLHRCMRRRFNRFVQVVQTDGGSEFEAEFAVVVWNYCRQHRIARSIVSPGLTRKTNRPTSRASTAP